MSVRRYSLNFAPRPAPRGRDGKELIQCPTSSCDGMGHVSGNYATHRRQGTIDIYTKPLTWTLDYVYIDMTMQHARKHATYIHIYIHAYTWTCAGPLWFLNKASIDIFILKKRKPVDDDISWNTHIHAYNKRHYVNCKLHLHGWFLHRCILVVRGVVAS